MQIVRELDLHLSRFHRDFGDLHVTCHFATAYRTYMSCKDNLERIFLNSLVIPSVIIWENSQAKKNIDNKEAKKLIARLQEKDGKRRASDTQRR